MPIKLTLHQTPKSQEYKGGYNFFCFVACCMLSACQSYTQNVSISVEQPVIPVLTMKAVNPVLKIELVKKDLSVCSIHEVVLSLEGTTDLEDIKNIGLYAAGADGMISAEKPLGKSLVPAKIVSFGEELPFSTDTLTFWVAVKLKDKVNLEHRINVNYKTVLTSDGEIKGTSISSFSGLRPGVAVRQHGQDGVNTSRIPGLATTKKGTLLALYDARYESSRDLQGHMDIGLNRSMDGGETWEPMQVVLDRKEWGGLPEKYNGISDACVLIDDNTGDIYVAGLWMHGVLDGKTGKWVEGLTQDSTRWIHQWQSKGSQPGLRVKETSQFLITKSSDDGLTWSDPVNITAQTKRKEWWLFAPAPGHGITLQDGTLVFPTQGRDKNGLPFSNITWSNDGGKNWTTSNPAYNDVTECMAVELSDGSLMLNMRDNRNRGNMDKNGRRICVTSDLGETWTEHPTSRKALIEPTCMGSIHKHFYKQDGEEKAVLLFSNPESRTSRDHMTLKISFDDGKTWLDDKKIVLDEYDGFGYSCITSVNDSVIGILYESSQANMVFQQIQLKEFIKK